MAGKITRLPTAMIASAVILLGACSLPYDPSVASIEPSASPSPTHAASPSTVPETPSPSPNARGRVTIDVVGQTLSYETEVCPLAAWQDPAVDDGIDFGSYPQTVASQDGTSWLTHMFMLDVEPGSVGDWSFVLTADLGGTPSEIERIVSSRGGGDTTIELVIRDGRATIRTSFLDSEASDPTKPRQGTVTVACV